MKSKYAVRRYVFAAGLALAALGNAGAQEVIGTAPARNDHLWDCWIGHGVGANAAGYVIRCIGDREAVTTDPAPGTPEAKLLDRIHDLIHAGDLEQLDNEVAQGLSKKIAGHLWQIRVPEYPPEADWSAGKPHKMVQKLICAGVRDCPVMIQR
jgi:hypothetical protein